MLEWPCSVGVGERNEYGYSGTSTSGTFSSISIGGVRYGNTVLSLASYPLVPSLPALAPDPVRLGTRCDAIAFFDKLLPSDGPPSTGDDVTDEARLTLADTGTEDGNEWKDGE